MTVESYLSNQLRKFTLIDFFFVKSVYFVSGLLMHLIYPALSSLDWWFYLALTIICVFPLYGHFLSQSGNLCGKADAYLKSNNPSNQVLLFLSIFFFALMLSSLFPILVSGRWWMYVLMMVVLAIKPLTKTWFW